MLFDNVHFVSETLGDSLEHIFDMRGNSVENSRLLVGAHVGRNIEEFHNLVVFLFLTSVNFNSKMFECLGKGSSLSLDNYNS